MRPPSATQSRAVAVAPAPRGFPVVACPESIARGIRCLLLTHISIKDLLGAWADGYDRRSRRNIFLGFRIAIGSASSAVAGKIARAGGARWHRANSAKRRL